MVYLMRRFVFSFGKYLRCNFWKIKDITTKNALSSLLLYLKKDMEFINSEFKCP